MTYIAGTIAIDFEDISTIGTAVSLGDDVVSSAIAMPFSFKFFGFTYNETYIRLICDSFCLTKCLLLFVCFCLFILFVCFWRKMLV